MTKKLDLGIIYFAFIDRIEAQLKEEKVKFISLSKDKMVFIFKGDEFTVQDIFNSIIVWKNGESCYTSCDSEFDDWDSLYNQAYDIWETILSIKTE